MLEALHSVIDTIIQKPVNDDDDKLHLCVLAEIRHKLYVKMDAIQGEYQMSMSPAQAIALRILATDYITDHTSYIGNYMLIVANEVDKQYS